MRAYRMKADRVLRGDVCAKVGDIVYPIRGHDYGLASDDEWATGIPHRSVTLDRAGGYPSFTVPVPHLDQFEAPDFEPLEAEHVTAVCRPGTAECCRYLTADASGWSCAKLTSVRPMIDMRADAGLMRATSDNCEGRAAFVKAVA